MNATRGPKEHHYQTFGVLPDGRVNHAGPTGGKPTLRFAQKHERRWLAWRWMAYPEQRAQMSRWFVWRQKDGSEVWIDLRGGAS